MKEAIRVPPLTEEQHAALEQLYRRTKLPRVRTRAQMVLLSAEQRLKAEEIAVIVRESAVTVLTWLKRYLAEGIEGLQDAPRAGRSAIVTEEFRMRRFVGSWPRKGLCSVVRNIRFPVRIPNTRSKKGGGRNPRWAEGRRSLLLCG